MTVLEEQSRTRMDLARSLDLVARAITRQATGIESLVAGVNHNTSRVGAVSGEMSKIRRWLEWALLPRPLPEGQQKVEDLLVEQNESMQELTTELQTLETNVI